MTLSKTIFVALSACAILASRAADEKTPEAAPPKVLEQTYQRAAIPGKPVRLEFLYAMKIDCTTTPLELRVAMRPEQGEVSIVQAEDSPRVASDSPGAECNKRKITGKSVMYTARPGYTGSDSVVIEALFGSGGIVRRYTYLIDVSNDPRVVRLDPPAARPQAVAAPQPRSDPAAGSSGPYDFDCDAPEAASSSWSGPLPAGRALISGNIKVASTRKHETFTPMGGIVLFDKAQPDVAATLSFVAFPQKPGKVDAMITMVSRPAAPPRRIALVSLPAGDKISFTVRLEAGVLEVSVGSVNRKVDVDFLVPTRMSLSCSTGNFLFDNVTVAN